MSNLYKLIIFLTIFTLSPEVSQASGGIAEFAGPIETIVNTLRGPVGRSLSSMMIILCGIGYFWNRGEEIAGLWKNLTGVAFIIVLICFSDKIINTLFGGGFTGAVI